MIWRMIGWVDVWIGTQRYYMVLDPQENAMVKRSCIVPGLHGFLSRAVPSSSMKAIPLRWWSANQCTDPFWTKGRLHEILILS